MMLLKIQLNAVPSEPLTYYDDICSRNSYLFLFFGSLHAKKRTFIYSCSTFLGSTVLLERS